MSKVTVNITGPTPTALGVVPVKGTLRLKEVVLADDAGDYHILGGMQLVLLDGMAFVITVESE